MARTPGAGLPPSQVVKDTRCQVWRRPVLVRLHHFVREGRLSSGRGQLAALSTRQALRVTHLLTLPCRSTSATCLRA